MPKDRIQSDFVVGDIVNVPAKVTAVGGTTTKPTVALTSKYEGFDGNTDSVTTLDAIQVIKDK
jgi:hypothetical protein